MSELIAIAAFKIQSPIEAPFHALNQWNRRRQTIKALNKLSTQELADIGIERANIKELAYKLCH